tara:strand:+ start:152 stop:1045 length:894 start_codon:yes stop_codon:yes gene_type:complete
MDLRLLEIFWYVYEEQSFSMTAQRLGLSQPTISDHIRSLEAQIGTKLFERKGRQIQPTSAAEGLYPHSTRIVETRRAAEEAMSEFVERVEGRLGIGGSTIPGEYLLPGLVGAFSKEFPRAEVNLRIGDTEQILRMLNEAEIEVAFVGARRGNETLRFRKFAQDELVLIAPNTDQWSAVHSITVGELAELPLVIREAGSGTRSVFEKHLKKLKLNPSDLRIAAEVGSTSGVKEAVRADLGIGVVSDKAISLELEAGVLKVVQLRGADPMRRVFYIATDTRRQQSRICRRFVQFVLRHS